jgi:hypothetical protein
MFDFDLKSKQHHKSDGHGAPVCGVVLLGLVMLWDDENVVTCPACLKKLREDRLAAKRAKEDAEK